MIGFFKRTIRGNELRLLPLRVYTETWQSFGMFVLGLMIFLLLRQLGELVEWAVNQGVTFYQVGLMMLLSVPWLLLLVVPISVVAAIFTVIVRYSRNSELAALMASGVSLRSYAQGFFVFAFSVAVLVSAFSLWLTPLSYKYFNQLWLQVGSTQVFQQLRPGQLNFSLPELVVLSGKVEEDNHLYDVNFMTRRPKEIFNVISASHGFLLGTEEQHQLLLVLEDGKFVELNTKDGGTIKTSFERFEHLIKVAARSGSGLNFMAGESSRQLRQRLRENRLGGRTRFDLEFELARRWLIPLTCVAFAIASIPMAVLDPRSGRSAGYLRAVMLVFVYYLAWLAFKDLVKWRGLHVMFMFVPLLLVSCYGFMRLWQLSNRPWA